MQRADRRNLIARDVQRARAKGLALVFCAFLTACSVSSPLAVKSSGQGIAPGTAVSLSDEETPRALRERFSKALAKAFDGSSSQLSENAPVFAEFAIAQTAATEGIVSGTGENSAENETIKWLSEPRRNRDFDKCAAQRIRASLILYDRESGDIVYSGQARAIECGFSDEDIAMIAEALVQDALAKNRP